MYACCLAFLAKITELELYYCGQTKVSVPGKKLRKPPHFPFHVSTHELASHGL